MNGKEAAGVLIILGIIVLCILCAVIIVLSGIGLAAAFLTGGFLFILALVVTTICGAAIALFSRKAATIYFVIEALVLLATWFFSHASVVLK